MLKKESVLSMIGISKSFSDRNILDHISWNFLANEVTALYGASGCGKTSLLQIIGLMDTPDSGSIIIDGKDCSSSLSQRVMARRFKIGYVYQFHHLISGLSVEDNISIPGLLQGKPRNYIKSKVNIMASKLGIKNILNQNTSTLSGGEKQRVAIARALALEPKLVIADEPTGNLDPANAELVFDLFLNISRELSTTVILATHNSTLMKRADKQLTIKNGKLCKIKLI